jgi:GNAT superfamily N-acetyltransferase
MDVEIRVERLDAPLVAPLLAAFGAEIEERYRHDVTDEERRDAAFELRSADELAAPGGTFLVALADDEPVGCVGIRRYPRPDRAGVGEVKRMYVAPRARRSGLGRLLLGAAVDAARQLGYERVVLETGTRQPEAMALYESAGFRPIPPYGEYRHEPISRCYELPLSGS